MPSLRRSLIVYFLALLTLGLGAIGLVAVDVSGRALADKQAVAAEAVDRRADERIKDEREKADKDLLSRARVVARSSQSEYLAEVILANRQLPADMLVQQLGLAIAPVRLTALPSWQLLTANPRRGFVPLGPFAEPVVRRYFSPLKLDEALAKHAAEDDRPGEFVQVNTPRTGPPPPPDDPTDERTDFKLPFDAAAFAAKSAEEVNDWWFDGVTLPGDVPARRVVLKTTVPSPFGGPQGMWGGRGGGGGGGGGGRGPGGAGRDARPPRDGQPGGPKDGPPGVPPPAQPRFDPARGLPFVYVHVARPTVELEQDIARIRESAAAEKADLAALTAAGAGTVRWTLAGIGGAAFVGLLVGGWVLIGHSLSPLRKLSDAVSRVSEKDFRLPVEPAQLSRELLPIHARLTHSLAALRRAFEREKEAVADISHELRTPVAGLLATIDVALRKPRTTEQYKATLEDCRAICKQLGGLVERVMTLASLDSGQAVAAPLPTDAAELATGCAAVIRPLAEAHGLTLATEVHAPTELTTDADKLREVMMNLLHNAVEYNRPGGTVTLRVGREPNAGPVVVEVADTGIGMTADVRGKIFDRFFRADASRTATGVHAGLGLAIVKEYVARLGGRIDVQSEPDRGSTFRVTLPG